MTECYQVRTNDFSDCYVYNPHSNFSCSFLMSIDKVLKTVAKPDQICKYFFNSTYTGVRNLVMIFSVLVCFMKFSISPKRRRKL
jgi:hypothetical protein